MTDHSTTSNTIFLNIHSCSDVTVLTVVGDLDLCSSPRLEIELSTADPGLPLIVDLREVTFCSAGCLGLLEVAHASRAVLGTSHARAGFAVLIRHQAVLRPLRLLGLHQVLVVAAMMEQARVWLGLPPQPIPAAELR